MTKIFTARPSPVGFTLLEVLVSFALLSLSFTPLVLVQARATRLAGEARNISIATALARYQLMECKREVQKVIKSVSDFEAEGDFKDLGFPQFSFECHAPKFNMATPSATQVGEMAKRGAPEAAEEKEMPTSISAPFVNMIIESLGDSVRELAVIVRWKDNDVEDEVRVVTHVIDLDAMAVLSRMLAQGAQAFEKSFGGAKRGEERRGPGARSSEGGR